MSSTPPKAPHYRLVLAATAPEMGQIALALASQFPLIAAAIDRQRQEIQNSGTDVFGAYRHGSDEPIVGLSPCSIETMSGSRAD